MIRFKSLFAALMLLGGAARAQIAPPSQASNAPKPKAFEISHGNLFEALRQMAAYRKLDLLLDPDVPNQKGLYAFKHTTWEKALDALMTSHGLSYHVKDGILRVGLASRWQGDSSRPAAQAANARTVAITYRPAQQGEALLSLSVYQATKAEILEALAKIERISQAKPGQPSFTVNWVLRPVKDASREEFETYSMEDVTPSGLRALYP